MKPLPTRRRFLTLASLAGLSLPPMAARAQDATGEVRLLFGLPPGAVGTKLAQGAIDQLVGLYPQRLRLEHVLGKESRKAVEVLKAAEGDGTTLMMCQSSVVSLFPNTYQNLGYSALSDMTPLSSLGAYAFMLVVGPAVPTTVRTFDDFVRWLADNPESRNLGVTLKGSQAHLAALAMEREKGATSRPLPYSGTAPITKDLLSSALAAAIIPTGNLQRELADGTVRALFVTSDKRWRNMSAVPTTTELGFDDLVLTGWYGWFGPKSLKPEIATRVVGALDALLVKPEFLALQAELSLQQLRMTPAQMRERIQGEIDFYREAVKAARLKPTKA